MMAQKHVLGLVDAGGEIRRAPLVGMQFLHEGAMRPANLLGRRPRLQAKDLIGLLFRHFAAARRRVPRTCVTLRVVTPAGLPAIKISCQ